MHGSHQRVSLGHGSMCCTICCWNSDINTCISHVEHWPLEGFILAVSSFNFMAIGDNSPGGIYRPTSHIVYIDCLCSTCACWKCHHVKTGPCCENAFSLLCLCVFPNSPRRMASNISSLRRLPRSKLAHSWSGTTLLGLLCMFITSWWL